MMPMNRQNYDKRNVQFTDEKGYQLHAESMGKFMELHFGRTCSVKHNLCEQRMKSIKLNLKVCQNFGSETAAENASFMFSLVESCKLKEESYVLLLI